MVLTDQDSLDPGRSQLDAEGGASFGDRLRNKVVSGHVSFRFCR